MANPWTKKNPLLSMVLSGANAWAGAARGVNTAQAKRQQAVAMRAGAKKVTDFWAAALTGGAIRKPKNSKKQRS